MSMNVFGYSGKEERRIIQYPFYVGNITLKGRKLDIYWGGLALEILQLL